MCRLAGDGTGCRAGRQRDSIGIPGIDRRFAGVAAPHRTNGRPGAQGSHTIPVYINIYKEKIIIAIY